MQLYVAILRARAVIIRASFLPPCHPFSLQKKRCGCSTRREKFRAWGRWVETGSLSRTLHSFLCLLRPTTTRNQGPHVFGGAGEGEGWRGGKDVPSHHSTASFSHLASGEKARSLRSALFPSPPLEERKEEEEEEKSDALN